jgi:hypothetical protein
LSIKADLVITFGKEYYFSKHDKTFLDGRETNLPLFVDFLLSRVQQNNKNVQNVLNIH